MSSPFEWRINEIEQKAERASSQLYRLDAISSDMACVERTLGEVRADIDGLRTELQAQADRITALEQQVILIQEPLQ
jgi:septal ring factor EnvC (AmiA/AmiB activator)